jgi:hypothetical protein
VCNDVLQCDIVSESSQTIDYRIDWEVREWAGELLRQYSAISFRCPGDAGPSDRRNKEDGGVTRVQGSLSLKLTNQLERALLFQLVNNCIIFKLDNRNANYVIFLSLVSTINKLKFVTIDMLKLIKLISLSILSVSNLFLEKR